LHGLPKYFKRGFYSIFKVTKLFDLQLRLKNFLSDSNSYNSFSNCSANPEEDTKQTSPSNYVTCNESDTTATIFSLSNDDAVQKKDDVIFDGTADASVIPPNSSLHDSNPSTSESKSFDINKKKVSK
jgi:hypothetical protein